MTVGSLMVLVLISAVVITIYQFMKGMEGKDWVQGVLVVHGVVIAVVVPLMTCFGCLWFAKGSRGREERVKLILAFGALGWVLALGSLTFCSIMILVGW